MNSFPYITRLGPSPTGMFHLGTARTALFNYLAARGSKGKFILRIDDTDIERNKQEYTDIILQSLEWLGLEYDELYYQSQRTELYLKASHWLLETGKAHSMEGSSAVLLKPPVELPESFYDEVNGKIEITETNRLQIEGGIIGSKTSNGTVLLREDQTPTYQFASVVDDYDLGINYIIRGVDHITNTPKQIAIWNALMFLCVNKDDYPKFAHIGLIHKDKKKLSKRDNAASLLWYKENGYSPNAVLNFILRLGWGSKFDKNTILTKQEMIDIFPLGRMRAAPSSFDQNKLDYYERQYKKMSKM